jgi:hypothetical protein
MYFIALTLAMLAVASRLSVQGFAFAKNNANASAKSLQRCTMSSAANKKGNIPVDKGRE